MWKRLFVTHDADWALTLADRNDDSLLAPEIIAIKQESLAHLSPNAAGLNA